MQRLVSRVLPAAVAALALAPGRVAGQAPRYTPADVEFMQGMIAHHAQAMDMIALVPEPDRHRVPIRLLAQRIDMSQRDEIRLMRNWLTERRPGRVPGAGVRPHQGIIPAAGTRSADAGDADGRGDGPARRGDRAPSSTGCFSRS